MTQPDKMTSNTDPVSTITKHIKIYSDNPIHDCIDRIIESSTMLDSVNTDEEYYLTLLRDAANVLFGQASSKLHELRGQRLGGVNEKKPN